MMCTRLKSALNYIIVLISVKVYALLEYLVTDYGNILLATVVIFIIISSDDI